MVLAVQRQLVCCTALLVTLSLFATEGIADPALVERADSVTSTSAGNFGHPSWSNRLRLDLGVFYSSPGALEKGMASGVLAGTALPLTSWMSLGLQFGVGQVEASNLTYRLEHTELNGLITAEFFRSVGRAQLGLVMAAGALVLNEQRSRHGSMRIAAAGLEPSTSVWTSGPEMRIGPRIRLNVVHRMDVLVETDLTYSFTTVNDEFRGRTGWVGLFALGYRL